ncbi:MAG TPA: hypothetical protein VMZ51_03475 [Acidimicrobiales bacterium]|nr:hypothetical protein [Acidimicrobiales bacterium]
MPAPRPDVCRRRCRTLFPGTGFVHELGEGDAVGTNVNIALPPGVGDEGWLAAFNSVVPPLVEAFAPGVLVTQLGCDTHHSDPLANLALTTAAYRRTASVLHDLAHRAAGGRWLATGGGGYQWGAVVPRAWTIYFAEMAGVELADELPAAWVEHAGTLRMLSNGPGSAWTSKRMQGVRPPKKRSPALRSHRTGMIWSTTRTGMPSGPTTNRPAGTEARRCLGGAAGQASACRRADP